jgi:hypothetical protein
MKRILTIATLALASVALAGSVYAAIPSADGVISACKSADGSIKLVDNESGQACKANQKLIQWNQVGPQGPAGTGISGVETVYAVTPFDSSMEKTHTATCPGTKSVISGGAGVWGEFYGGGQLIIHYVGLMESAPQSGNAWNARAEEFAPVSTNWALRVWAICADVS